MGDSGAVTQQQEFINKNNRDAKFEVHPVRVLNMTEGSEQGNQTSIVPTYCDPLSVLIASWRFDSKAVQYCEVQLVSRL